MQARFIEFAAWLFPAIGLTHFRRLNEASQSELLLIFSLAVGVARHPHPLNPWRIFSTLDELVATQSPSCGVRHRLRPDRRHLVLRHAEIHPRAVISRSSPCRFRTMSTCSQLGMDCRYCHSFVDVAAHSEFARTTRPAWTATRRCRKTIPKLEPVRASWKTGQPGRVGADSIARPITFITTTARARQPRHQLRELSRPGQLGMPHRLP